MTLGRGGFFFDTHGPIIVDPDEDIPGSGPIESDEEEQDRSWASQDPNGFYPLRDAIQDILFNQYGIEIGATPLNQVLNQWGMSFQNRNGAFPTFDDILGAEDFWVQTQRRALNTSALPDWFWVDGPDGRVLYNNTGAFPAAASIDDWLARPDALKSLGARYGQPPNRESAYRLPVYSQEIFGSVLNLDALGIRRTGGGGRRAPIWDKAALEEGIQSMWRPLMLEEAPTGLVDQFVAEHASFLRQGGNLDLESWVLGKMRETGKYQTIYAKKDPTESEMEYISKYRQLAAQTGLSAGQVSRETLRGASTGAAPAGFAQSLQESADVQAIGTGAMSRRFAQTLAGIPS